MANLRSRLSRLEATTSNQPTVVVAVPAHWPEERRSAEAVRLLETQGVSASRAPWIIEDRGADTASLLSIDLGALLDSVAAEGRRLGVPSAPR